MGRPARKPQKFIFSFMLLMKFHFYEQFTNHTNFNGTDEFQQKNYNIQFLSLTCAKIAWQWLLNILIVICCRVPAVHSGWDNESEHFLPQDRWVSERGNRAVGRPLCPSLPPPHCRPRMRASNLPWLRTCTAKGRPYIMYTRIAEIWHPALRMHTFLDPPHSTYALLPPLFNISVAGSGQTYPTQHRCAHCPAIAQ